MNDLHKSIVEHIHANGKDGMLLRKIALGIDGGIPGQEVLNKFLIACQILVEQGYLQFSSITDLYKPGKRTLKKENKKPNKRKPGINNKTVDKIIEKKEEVNVSDNSDKNLTPSLSSRTTKIIRIALRELNTLGINTEIAISEDSFKRHLEEYFATKAISGLIKNGQLGTAFYTMDNRHIIYRHEGDIYFLTDFETANKLIDEIESCQSDGYYHAGLVLKEKIRKKCYETDEEESVSWDLGVTPNTEGQVKFSMKLDSKIIKEITVEGEGRYVSEVLDQVMLSIAERMGEAA